MSGGPAEVPDTLLARLKGGAWVWGEGLPPRVVGNTTQSAERHVPNAGHATPVRH